MRRRQVKIRRRERAALETEVRKRRRSLVGVVDKEEKGGKEEKGERQGEESRARRDQG